MSQKEVELILARQLASYLALPIFLIGPEGALLYYNEPAEGILGRRYDETGEMKLEEWTTGFVPLDENAEPLSPDELPLVIALRERRPAHREFQIRGMDGKHRRIEVSAFPIVGQAGRFLGAMALFWETPTDGDHLLGNPRLGGGSGT